MTGGAQGIDIINVNSTNALCRQHALAGAFPIHIDDMESFVAFAVLFQFGRRRPFQAQIQFDPDPFFKGIYDSDGLQAADRGVNPLRHFRQKPKQANVAIQLVDNTGPQDLDCDIPPIRRYREMDLRDGGCGDRIPVKLRKGLHQWHCQGFFDGRNRLIGWERIQPVL